MHAGLALLEPAVFGLPGGAEWLIILGILVLGFGPYAVIGWVAYRLGLSKGRETAGGEPRVAPFRQPAEREPSDVAYDASRENAEPQEPSTQEEDPDA